MILKKIGVMSAGKISCCINCIMGLIFGALFSFTSLFALGGATEHQVAGLIFGLGAIIFLPILYGIFGFFGGIIGAFIYNKITGFVGGLEMEFEDDKPISEYPISQ